jgi:2-polyprenyl-6-methoxyphenol hydroxylase-like FAD-dependent oxidoreductase
MYDAIVVGARVAGAATAMLLAREGHRVLLVDRAEFPSEIPKGHFVHRHGPQHLRDWGLLERVLDTGCPAITTLTLHQGDFPLVGTDLVVDGVPLGVGPRRSHLDKVLVDAAVEAGAELREHFPVRGYTSDDGRITGVRAGSPEVAEQAKITIGADGRNSALAKHVGAASYNEVPSISCWYFSYWSGVEGVEGLELSFQNERGSFAFPTHDALTAVFVSWPVSETATIKADIEGEFANALALASPSLAERVREGERVERFYGATQLPNFLRVPHGPGWALVGDAGCHKDPLMALGCCDALRDAELLAEATHEGLTGERPLDEALADYGRRRDEETMPLYEMNLQAARLQPPPPEVLALRAAVRGSPEDTRALYMSRQGMRPYEEFFNPENMARLMGAPA